MTVAIALFTRDLRVDDNPVLAAATLGATCVLPLFVLDPVLLASSSPNRRWALAQSLAELRVSLRGHGGDLVVRSGDPVEVVAALIGQLEVAGEQVTELHVAQDVSRAAVRRRTRLRGALPGSLRFVEHDSHGIVAPGALRPSGGDHYKVFTPYFRAWDAARRRPLADMPQRIRLPEAIDCGELPLADALADGATSPGIRSVDETSAKTQAVAWLTEAAGGYQDGHDDLGGDRTSRLSGALHYGTISARRIEEHLDLDDPGHAAFRRQLCWRDFSQQLLSAFPRLPAQDLRPRGDMWRSEADEIEAWTSGHTGYPIVDAGMRQLLAQGWMHNRARMIVASLLTKTLYVDWRVGQAHFAHWLVDADVANNAANWQWVAGTGADSRPNRVLNPIRQALRYDPDASYVRRWVPELRDVVDPRDVHEPWRLSGTFDAPDYPPPIVALSFGRDRFLAARDA
jgi:deoxyribodipyrimidine photo-lyase